jgi:hypothetical protein
MPEYTDKLKKMVAAAQKLMPKKTEADKILTELQRLERRERQETSPITTGVTAPED